MADTWFPRILTLLAWALAAWSVVYWALQFQASGSPAAASALPAAPATAPAADAVDIARVFGPAIETQAAAPVVAAVVDPSTRFALLGVVANRTRRGVALLSVEGKPARPYRVGASIEDAYTLKSVTTRTAVLVDTASGTTFTVALADPAGGPAAPGPAAVPGATGTGAARNDAPATRPSPGIPMPRFGPIPAASAGRRSS